jgi:peptidoglycan LD-endopeptidase CwlK
MIKLSNSSKEKLATCCKDIQDIVNYAADNGDIDFTVICGHRGKEEQEAALKSGASKAKFGQSGHNQLPSIAIDIVPYPIDWNDLERFKKLAAWILECSGKLGKKLYWGGNWPKFRDYPHYSINNK